MRRRFIVAFLTIIVAVAAIGLYTQSTKAQELTITIIADPDAVIKVDTRAFPDGEHRYEVYSRQGELITSGPIIIDNYTTSQQISKGFHYYLVDWVWVTELYPNGSEFSYWTTEYENKGSLDLRTRSQYAIPGGAKQCCALIASATEIQNDPNVVHISDSLSEVFTATTASQIQSKLKIPNIQARNLSDLTFELLIDEADPTGNAKWKPLRPNKYGVVHANIGQVRLFTERLSKSSPEWNKVILSLRNDYESIRIRDFNLALKQAGYWEIKYGFDIRSEAQKIRDGATRKPETTYTESFTCSDSTTITCDLTWSEVDSDWEITSNAANLVANGIGSARADHDLSSTDHFAQIDCQFSTDFEFCGVSARFSSSADTSYIYRLDNDAISHNLYRYIAGSPTLLVEGGGDDSCSTACPVLTIKLDVNGNDLEGFLDGISQITYTDSGGSEITTGTRCGLWGFDAGVTFDNFVCEDAGVTPPVEDRMHITIVE